MVGHLITLLMCGHNRQENFWMSLLNVRDVLNMTTYYTEKNEGQIVHVEYLKLSTEHKTECHMN